MDITLTYSDLVEAYGHHAALSLLQSLEIVAQRTPTRSPPILCSRDERLCKAITALEQITFALKHDDARY